MNITDPVAVGNRDISTTWLQLHNLLEDKYNNNDYRSFSSFIAPDNQYKATDTISSPPLHLHLQCNNLSKKYS